MLRKMIRIDEEKCNGCGACAAACHEGAIDMVNGKAKLAREHYCDGLGDCLPACPTGAITFEVREAPAYDEAAVKAAQAKKAGQGCPGAAARVMKRTGEAEGGRMESCLGNWPVQIKLAPVNAPVFENADLLIAADCTAYAYANFHSDFIRGRVTLIACPKLDMVDYAQKLTAIFKENSIKSITLVRMEVPCCGGLENAAKRALLLSGKEIPLRVVTVTTDGRIRE